VSTNQKNIIFVPYSRNLITTGENKLLRERQSHDFLQKLYLESAPKIGLALNRQRQERKHYRCWLPLARTSTLTLLSHLIDSSPNEVRSTDELVAGAQENLDIDRFKRVSGLVTESEVGLVLVETAESMAHSDLLSPGVELMFRYQIGTLQSVQQGLDIQAMSA
jgi:hypothetical protein